MIKLGHLQDNIKLKLTKVCGLPFLSFLYNLVSKNKEKYTMCLLILNFIQIFGIYEMILGITSQSAMHSIYWSNNTPVVHTNT